MGTAIMKAGASRTSRRGLASFRCVAGHGIVRGLTGRTFSIDDELTTGRTGRATWPDTVPAAKRKE